MSTTANKKAELPLMGPHATTCGNSAVFASCNTYNVSKDPQLSVPRSHGVWLFLNALLSWARDPRILERTRCFVKDNRDVGTRDVGISSRGLP